jgi:hypothetical protein
MVNCPRCNGESPPGSLHCVQCGLRMAGQESTQFGMPAVRPAPESARGAGPQTTQFGADDLARLAAAAEEANLVEPEAEVSSSLLAGLPRPRVSSAPSPLTEGLKKPVRPADRPKPSARSTVMGMPLYGSENSDAPAGVLPEPAKQRPEAAMSDEAAAAQILSLDSFGKDFDSAAPGPALSADPQARTEEPEPAAPEPGAAPDSGVRVSRVELAPPPAAEPRVERPKRPERANRLPAEPTRPMAPEASPSSGGSGVLLGLVLAAALMGLAWALLK